MLVRTYNSPLASALQRLELSRCSVVATREARPSLNRQCRHRNASHRAYEATEIPTEAEVQVGKYFAWVGIDSENREKYEEPSKVRESTLKGVGRSRKETEGGRREQEWKKPTVTCIRSLGWNTLRQQPPGSLRATVGLRSGSRRGPLPAPPRATRAWLRATPTPQAELGCRGPTNSAQKFIIR